MTSEPTFRERVYIVVAQIPTGRVMTYGDIAALCGEAHAARIVGGIAHFGPTDLPWQRIVNRYGGLASGFYGGKLGHKHMLEAEGVEINDDFQVIQFKELRWHP